MHKIIEEWFKFIQTKYSSHTFLAYKKDIIIFTNFIQYYTGEEFNPLKPQDIKVLRSWISYLKIKLKINSQPICRMISSLKNLAQYINNAYKVEWQDLFILKTPKFTKKIIRDIDVDKLLNLLDKLPENTWVETRNKSLLYLLYSTGIRISEALSLIKKNIYEDKCIVLGKGQKYREVFLLPQAYKLLTKYTQLITFEKSDEEPIFLGVFGKTLRAPVARKYVQNLRRKHGLPEYLSPHLFRHCFARHLLDNNTSLLTISEALGHKSLNSTERYMYINKEKMKNAYNQFAPGSDKK